MRIVLDLQSCQTEGSKNRGIGRYSIALAEAMIAEGSADHEFLVVLNGAFPEAAAAIRERLHGQVPADRIRTFDPVVLTGQPNPPESWRTHMSSMLRDDMIASLDPDAVHVTSLFEGGDLSVIDIPPHRGGVIQAVTVYDLIPYINPDKYLGGPGARDWYYRKLLSLKRADVLLAISASSRGEAIEHLHIPAERVVNISSAISPVFAPRTLSDDERAALRARYGLRGRFVMYTGGIDHRKNIEGLIEAFALLDDALRQDRQLAIVCSISPSQRESLLATAKDFGLDEGQVVLTGYVSEDDLIALYNSCEMFVFPSLHEGFGLPVLEAMSCGVPTIGSHNSSIPEVIGYDEALFDPKDPYAIADKIARVLREPDFAERLRRHGLERSRLFSWEESARRALRAIETAHAAARAPVTIAANAGPTRLAFVSPFPPLNSGIAGYSAGLLPELSRYYEIDIVVDQPEVDSAWAAANCAIVTPDEFERRSDAGFYDRIVYHFGNSQFHAHMPDLLLRHPGVVVLHDFFLSGLQDFRQVNGRDGAFINALLDSHGYAALSHMVATSIAQTIGNYPANGPVVRAAAGVIVHSSASLTRLTQEYGIGPGNGACHIPLLRVPPTIDRATARTALGLAPDDIMICSFGIVAPEKLSHLVLEAFVAAGLTKVESVRLVFVGSASGAYGEALARQMRATGRNARVSSTGFVDERTYAMHLAAADLAIQLRTSSRGETSAAALDVLNYGVPLIVNAHGTMAELDPSAVVMLDDPVSVDTLAATLGRLIQDPAERTALADAGKALIDREHAPALAGALYHDAIEDFAARHPLARHSRLLRQAAQSARMLQPDAQDIAIFAASAARNIPHLGMPRMFVDISGAVADAAGGAHLYWVLEAIDAMIAQEGAYRIEPVYMAAGETVFRAARQLVTTHLGWHGGGIVDTPMAPEQGDMFLGLDCSFHSADIAATQGMFHRWRAHGITVAHVLRHEDVEAVIATADAGRASRGNALMWLGMIAEGADIIVTSSEQAATALHTTLDLIAPPRQTHLDIVYPSIPVADDGLALIDVVMTPEQARQSLAWVPRLSYRFDGASQRLATACGERRGRTIVSAGRGGALVYGPYQALPAGSYEARVWGTIRSDRATEGFVDATIGGGRTVIGRVDMTPSPGGHAQVAVLARLTFTLDRSCTDMEVRIWADPETDMVFHRLDIRQVHAS